MSIEVHREFFAVALSLPLAGLTLTYWFVHCDEAAVWTTYNDFDVRRRVRKDTSILGGDVMTIRKPVVSQAALVLASMASTAAFAQTAPGASDEAVEVDEIVVTGSRIARSDFSSTSPIVTYSEEAIAQSGTVNIEQAMNQLPQFVQGQTSSTVGAVALAGRASLNLRGLGETRNLVLLDGRRLPLSNANAVVDVNLIPQFILSGVETITGGASAVYGSDAMSGVVNFKSITDFTGLQLDVRSGVSEQGDGNSTDVGITAGFDIAEDRGNVLFSLGYTDRDVLWGKDRDFYQLGVLSSFIGTGTYVPSPTNLPQQSVVNTVFGAYGVAPGAVLNSRSLGVNDNGTLFGQIGAFNYQGPTTEYFSTTGGTVRQPVTYQEFVINPMKRKSFFGKFDFKVADCSDCVRPVSLQQDHGYRPGRLVAYLVRRAHGAGHQSVHSRGPQNDSGIASAGGRGFHASTIGSWDWTSVNFRPTSPPGNTFSDCAATCHTRTGVGTSMVRTTRLTSWRRRTRPS